MPHPDEGLWSWKQPENHNHVLELQRGCVPAPDEVRFDFFGGSAFKITTPAGLVLFIDPWRNLPTGGEGRWFLHRMPQVAVDVGLSTHAHWDHDALHLLQANMLLDRMAGDFAFADVRIRGIADKHVADFSGCLYNFTQDLMDRGVNPFPPDNPRSFDNNLLVIETGGLRILHWGDNRPDPPEAVWEMLGRIDVVLLPIDESRHLLTYEQADAILDRLEARVCLPHHYFIRGLTRMSSTLMPADAWVRRKPGHEYLDSASVTLRLDGIKNMRQKVLYFGDHLAFELP
jgi:L-ascorbate metabolism protein UlaG (beta-lactamase superfamily)